ncbi:hypothetical protein A3Q56_04014 [Intoshia linei]|uniref:Uncharacterized protein n=1 Tax=Intoshia linei TaxID=1819745 RepID=A0A177B293_9BILA|nr:hypothetical protein A3Q56_04014 [Intoshia linei]
MAPKHQIRFGTLNLQGGTLKKEHRYRQRHLCQKEEAVIQNWQKYTVICLNFYKKTDHAIKCKYCNATLSLKKVKLRSTLKVPYILRVTDVVIAIDDDSS